MNGAFRPGDWVVNGLLFTGYHLHVPWPMPATLFDTFTLAYRMKRYRSAWMGIAVHSAQSVFFAIALLLIGHLRQHRCSLTSPSPAAPGLTGLDTSGRGTAQCLEGQPGLCDDTGTPMRPVGPAQYPGAYFDSNDNDLKRPEWWGRARDADGRNGGSEL
jgi:hypothetical protein